MRKGNSRRKQWRRGRHLNWQGKGEILRKRKKKELIRRSKQRKT